MHTTQAHIHTEAGEKGREGGNVGREREGTERERARDLTQRLNTCLASVRTYFQYPVLQKRVGGPGYRLIILKILIPLFLLGLNNVDPMAYIYLSIKGQKKNFCYPSEVDPCAKFNL